MRGDVIDMDRLRNINGSAPAVGNAQVNARGDKLGPGGVILKTQEQIEHEWAVARAKNAPKPMDIKTPNRIDDAMARLAPKAKPALNVDDAGFDFEPSTPVPAAAAREVPAPSAPRRKVIDSE
jgi:predicted oxidoreductase